MTKTDIYRNVRLINPKDSLRVILSSAKCHRKILSSINQKWHYFECVVLGVLFQ